MGLMAMLEEVLNGEVATATVATPATHHPENAPTVATVAGVAVANATNHQTGRGDEIPNEVGNQQVATAHPETPPTVARVATVAVADAQKPQTDRPALRLVHSSDTPTECETLRHSERLQLFKGKGVASHAAAVLAGRLIDRDRQLDDRRSCAECTSYFAGNCRQRITPIGEITVHTLHRCAGFSPDLSEGEQEA